VPYGLHNFIILLITVLLTWFVYVDSHRLPMKHRNFWIIGTFLMAPLVFLVYLIRRAQVKHHQALSKRQQREAAARERSRQRKQRADQARALWKERHRQQLEAHPELEAQRKAETYKEQHEMRLRLDEQLSTQQARHAKQMGLNSK
jgi:hypothetical protein